ncbi:MAG TPA: dephospho-CoA kinase [Puia sp.]|nr:dephospho-CoA kinase [Puia sp.]
MLKIGLTGGIGSGKTTVAQIFEVLGIPVYHADEAAKKLMNENPELKKGIISRFGAGAYPDGKLDRRYLAELVFSDPEKLSRLNEMVHPVTLHDADLWMRKQHSPYVVKEAAIIFEANLRSFYDFVIGVAAPESLRIERVMKRDRSTREKVLLRIRQQMDEEEKMRLCDFVIVNDEQQGILPQVLKIHELLLAKGMTDDG